MSGRLSQAFAAAALLLPVGAAAQAPCAIPLQSYLAGLDGAPLPGPVDVEVRFYDGPDAGAAAIDCRSFPAVALDAGWLNVALDACSLPEPDASGCGVMTVGEILDAGRAEGTEIYMGIRLGDDAEDAGPRTPLGAVPYAVYATTASSLEGFDPAEYVPRADYDALAARVLELETRADSFDDLDGDGATNLEDCAPFDDAIHPGADEIPDDLLDSDCDGDSDGDGVSDDLDCAPFEADRIGPDGLSEACAVADCAEVLALNPGVATGAYWITGGSGGEPMNVLCDMHTDGGGWTLCGKFDRDSGDGSSLEDPFARARVHSDDLATVSSFAEQQASMDCRRLIRGGATWTLSAATDDEDPEWANARLVPMPAEVVADPTNLWDINYDEDGDGVCVEGVMDTFTADGTPIGAVDGGADLSVRGGLISDSAWWTTHRRAGATWSNAGFADCTGTADGTIHWSWVTTDGTQDDQSCGMTRGQLTIGTGCNQTSSWHQPTYRYNLLFMR